MASGRVIVLLPCHTLDDFPTWLEEDEADALLAAWTAAWHPALVAAIGRPPGHASVDLPPPAEAIGIVPAFCDERFAGQVDPAGADRWVRHTTASDAITRAVAERVGVASNGSGGLPGDVHADDFRGLGLAMLLAELLARRMRTDCDLAATGFDTAVVAAARAAITGDDDALRAGLAEAYGCLESIRTRFYAVESWAVDVVLLAPATLGSPLLDELQSPVPLAAVATGATIRRLAERHPASLAALRAAIAAGRVEPCGGRDDERPLDDCSPEMIRESFTRGREAWLEHVGAAPSCHAAISGGASAILPQLLVGLGYRGALWSLFDGTSLPDPGGGRILWEGTGGGAIEAIARPPLDAGRAASILELPDRIGDALDHDHVAVVQFAHYAGGASRWHGLVRRIGASSGLLGTFVTPAALVDRTAGGGASISFEPDAFPITTPPTGAGAGGDGNGPADPLTEAVARAGRDAATLEAAAHGVGVALPARAGRPRPATPRVGGGRDRHWLPAGLFGRRRDDDSLLLDNGLVALRPHPRSGGLLSLRRPADRANRISQQIALRTPPVAASHRDDPADRVASSRMEADSVSRHGGVGDERIESRGRLVAEDGHELGRFVQAMSLVPELPLAVIDLEVTLDRPVAGPLYEAHLACRFAWHENEQVEVRRSLHLQAIATERRRFTAPHFIEIVPEAARSASGGDAVVILTGGLPWHLLSSPHVLDTVLLAGGRVARRRLAVGIGLERPWDAAIAFNAGGLPACGASLPANVRLALDPGFAADPPGTLRVGIAESAGRAGEVCIGWARNVARAVAVDLAGRPLPDVAVAVAGRSTSVHLHRYQWLHLRLEFAEPGPPAVDPGDEA